MVTQRSFRTRSDESETGRPGPLKHATSHPAIPNQAGPTCGSGPEGRRCYPYRSVLFQRSTNAEAAVSDLTTIEHTNPLLQA